MDKDNDKIAAPAEAKTEEYVTFNALDSTDSDGSIESYSWLINNQTYDGDTVSVQFESAGDYDIQLTVTDDKGQSAIDSLSITIIEDDDEEPGGEETPPPVVIPGPDTGDTPVSLTISLPSEMPTGAQVPFSVSLDNADLPEGLTAKWNVVLIEENKMVSSHSGLETNIAVGDPGIYRVDLTLSLDGESISTTHYVLKVTGESVELPDTTEESESTSKGSSGGGSLWLLMLLAPFAVRRRKR